jgi:hypothetical protein
MSRKPKTTGPTARDPSALKSVLTRINRLARAQDAGSGARHH